ncbi:phage portal protein [Alkalibaculum sp. M08DMB]|uniref:Phage portal protein n=1 Tax=Alkalibaculum sporogenes TaxID=2655001 RepID=A0A6A7K8Y2_9FIRM|nr:phage portal protein [Alkalibaculum sporogenes]MPW25959.1 phage portal protein [Alkalibaculum sporogenes]
MLTNLNWLNKDSPYPPLVEKERIDTYKANEQLFLTKHSEVWKEAFQEISRRLKKKNHDVETIFNYQQLLSKKTADFVCGEPPTLETEQDTDGLIKLMEKQRFNTRLYESIIDVSRYGNAILKIVGKKVTAVSPLFWFPIVDPSDLKEIIQHVIAYPITPDDKGNMTELYVEIHSIGKIEQRMYTYNGEKHEIGELNEKSVKTENTGLQDFAVQTLTNITHSGSIFGIDDYAIINSIVAKIMWRLHCSDTVLDKHSEPSMSGPASALSYDERTGKYFLDLANYFQRNNKEDPDMQYITWDGNLESSFKEIEKLLDQLYTLSEMGQAFMEGGGGGEASSGTALKLRMVSPRIKAGRIASINAATVKQIISMLAQVNGIAIDYNGLFITWNDGLPDDEVEETNRLVTATGGKAIMSQYSALKSMGLTDDQVEAEMEQMEEERASSMPLQLSTIDSNTLDEPGEGDQDEMD